MIQLHRRALRFRRCTSEAAVDQHCQRETKLTARGPGSIDAAAGRAQRAACGPAAALVPLPATRHTVAALACECAWAALRKHTLVFRLSATSCSDVPAAVFHAMQGCQQTCCCSRHGERTCAITTALSSSMQRYLGSPWRARPRPAIAAGLLARRVDVWRCARGVRHIDNLGAWADQAPAAQEASIVANLDAGQHAAPGHQTADMSSRNSCACWLAMAWAARSSRWRQLIPHIRKVHRVDGVCRTRTQCGASHAGC
jgi:hypothetical protein